MPEDRAAQLLKPSTQLARQWIEVAIQTGFCLGLLVLVAGLFYPLYAFWPFPFNGLWQDRNVFLLEALHYAFAFLTLYMLGCWQWLQLHHDQAVPFKRFWVARQLTLSLIGTLVAVLPLQTVHLLGLPGPSPFAAYACGLFLFIYFIWPKLTELKRKPGSQPFAFTLALALTQATAFWLMPTLPKLACFLLLSSTLFLPVLASSWDREKPEILRDPWQLLFLLVLVGFSVLGATAWWSWNQLLTDTENIQARMQALMGTMRLERPVLRGTPIANNAYNAYLPIFGSQGHHLNTRFSIPLADSDRIRGMFNLQTGHLQPDTQLLTKYRSVLNQLEQASQHTWMKYPHGSDILPMPDVGLLQDLGLLRLADGISRCRPNDCLAGAQTILDSLRMLQDIPLHGFATPMMVAYKVERISLSALGFRLKPESLTLTQWQILLSEWQRLMAGEQAHFDKVIAMEMLLAQQTLISMLPQLESDVNATSGSLPEWLGILPYVRIALPELEKLSEESQAYLQQPAHHLSLWKELRHNHSEIVSNNPFARSVLIDVPALIYRFREHQTILRGFYQHLALQAYYAEQGHYPEELSALVPKWLPALPDDPFTGQSFAYHPAGKSYALYSLGLNQRDDGKGSYYGMFIHTQACQGDEIVFAPEVPEKCRIDN